MLEYDVSMEWPSFFRPWQEVGGYVKQVYFHGLFMSNKGVGFSVREFMKDPGRKWGDM